MLAGRDVALACEELTLRARADADAGRWRDCAFQLRAAYDAALAELLPWSGQADIDERLAELARAAPRRRRPPPTPRSRAGSTTTGSPRSRRRSRGSRPRCAPAPTRSSAAERRSARRARRARRRAPRARRRRRRRAGPSARASYGVGPWVTIATRAAGGERDAGQLRDRDGPRARSRRRAAGRRATASSCARSHRLGRQELAEQDDVGLERRRRRRSAATPCASATRRAPRLVERVAARRSTRHELCSIEPWTSTSSRVPALRCRQSMFWVITASSRPRALELGERRVRAVGLACRSSVWKRGR